MSYGGVPYAGGAYGGQPVAAGANNALPALAVEVAFTTNALATPAWVDITSDVREWDTSRGRNRELERFQPGRATIVLDNLSRQYDSSNSAGPWFGNLKPMRRVRIRQTFNGVTYPVFDGFVDKWQLDYPQHGKDATATIVATDAFKIFARTDLGKSVYANEVKTDAPVIWWRLDEELFRLLNGTALNAGSLGTTGDGTFVGSPSMGAATLVALDPGTAMATFDSVAKPGVTVQGVSLPQADFDLIEESEWSVEMWIRMDEASTVPQGVLWGITQSGDDEVAQLFWIDPDADGTTGQLKFQIWDSGLTTFYGVQTAEGSILPGPVHHVVASVESNGQMVIYLDGVRNTTIAGSAAGTSISGVTLPSGGKFHVAHDGRSSESASLNWVGEIDELAIYTTALSGTRVTAHLEAGTAPWNGDLPGARLDRVLDLVEWPDELRELDDGDTLLQSTQLDMPALEHTQKVGETEFGLLFVDRAGNVRFVSREGVFGRDPAPVVFGDGADELGYRDIKFDDGDEVIRNRATITQLNGVPVVAEDTASVQEFGRFDFDLSGLYHDSLTYSQNYANLIRDEYKNPRRRVTSLTLGPAANDVAADLYPQMLGRELGDSIVVKNRPPGGGDAFEQTCVIEGIRHREVPGPGTGTRGHLTTTWILSPEFSVRELEDEDVAALGYEEVTANQTGITTLTDLTGLTVDVTVGTNRRVRITASTLVTRTVADGTSALRIREGSTTLQIINIQPNIANEGVAGFGHVVLENPSAGAHTYKLSLERNTGTGTTGLAAGATFPASILVEDIGPAS